MSQHKRVTQQEMSARRLRILFAGTFVLASSLAAVASPESQTLRQQSETEMSAGRFDAAIQKAQAAVGADATDAEAQLVLGRAYLANNQYDNASAAFDEAARLDPQLTSRVQAYRLMIAFNRNDQAALQQSYENLIQSAPNSPLARNLENMRDRLGTDRTAPPTSGTTMSAEDDPFQVFSSLSAGYNDNAVFAGDNQPLSDDDDRVGSAFLNFTLDALYNWRRPSGDGFDVGYSFYGDFYKELSDVNLADHTLFANYRHSFSERTKGVLRLSDTYTMLGGERYRNQIALSPTISFRHSERSATEFSYNLAFNSYEDFGGIDEQDRDSTSHTLSLAHYFSPRNSRLRLRGGAYYLVNRADGSDYDFDSVGLFVGASHPLPWKMTGDISYSHSWDRYDNDNSLSDPAFSEKRRDNVNSLSFQLSRPLKRERSYDLDVFFRYAHTRDDSNIRFFKYRQNIVSLGISGAF